MVKFWLAPIQPPKAMPVRPQSAATVRNATEILGIFCLPLC